MSELQTIAPTTPEECACPSCGAQFRVDASAILPAETDLTLSLTITPGQLVMAKTLAGVIESFVALQVATGKSLGITTSVFIAGLNYADDRIDVTFRIANEVKGEIS